MSGWLVGWLVDCMGGGEVIFVDLGLHGTGGDKVCFRYINS